MADKSSILEQGIRPKFKRKQYIVSTRFQMRYVGQILLLVFLTAVLCSYVVYYTSMISLGEKLSNVYPQGRLVSIVKAVNFRILLSIIFVSPLVALIGIFLSHKIAGPIYRMERFVETMRAGDLTGKLALRQGDELIALANGIDALNEQLRAKTTERKQQLEAIAMELSHLKSGRHSHQESTDAINTLEGQVRRMLADLGAYKV